MLSLTLFLLDQTVISYNHSMYNLKKYFLLDPTVTFLNHGSFGATPNPVFKEYQRWQRELENQHV